MSRQLKIPYLRSAEPTQAGFTLPTVLSFIIAMSIIAATVMMIIINNITFSGQTIARQQALNIAEAGVNYYLWHMSHNSDDYKDGNTTPTTQTTYGFGP